MSMNKLARTKGDKILDKGINALLALILVCTLYPLYFVLIASISNPTAIANGQVILYPQGITFDGYTKLLENSKIWIGYRNSLFYATAGTFINIAVTVSCGFALSRKTLPGRRLLTIFFLFTMYFSGGLMPSYILMKDLGLLNTIWVVILPGAMSVTNMIIARTYFENSIPEAIFESARIDGANTLQYYFRFALPLAKSMIAVLTLFFALGHWNNYFGPMIYITDDNIQSLQVIIKNITANISSSMSETMTDADLIKAVQERDLLKYSVVVVSIVPMLLLYPFVQQYLITGVMLGAVKG